MVLKGCIRSGDPTTCGGQVISASTTIMVDDKPLSCIGDEVFSPMCGSVRIIEGSTSDTWHGKALAYDGCTLSCGHKVMSTTDRWMIEPNREAERPSITSPPHLSSASTPSNTAHDNNASHQINKDTASQRLLDETTYVEFQLVDHHENPIGEQNYILTTPDGNKISGKLDSNGFLRLENIKRGTCRIELPNLDKMETE